MEKTIQIPESFLNCIPKKGNGSISFEDLVKKSGALESDADMWLKVLWKNLKIGSHSLGGTFLGYCFCDTIEPEKIGELSVPSNIQSIKIPGLG